MKNASVQNLSRVLRVLVVIAFVCNLLALAAVPGLVSLKARSADQGIEYAVILSVFLLVCGTCTAVILWQARRVLKTILKGEPFSQGNAANMKRAGICCIIISTAALVRLIWGLFYYGTIHPLLTYNALFIPIFFMGFLLCMVMSALFRQAAELKEENDLTI